MLTDEPIPRAGVGKLLAFADPGGLAGMSNIDDPF
jgi:hypothetical protein